MADADPATDKPRVLGFQIPESLENELIHAAEKLHLSKSSVARLALQRGLTVLLEQLSQEGPTA